MDIADKVHFRQAHVSDVPFILSTWLRSNRPDPRIPARIYFKEAERRIKALLAQSETTLIVACSSSNEDALFGWLCASKLSDCQVLHFVFVKRAYRRFGIARALLSKVGAPDYHTHEAPMFRHLKLKSEFDPYLA